MKTEQKTDVFNVTKAESNQALRGTEILLADASVEQLAVLLDGLRPGVEVHLIHPHDDALALFAQCCAREHLDTLHVLGHGAPGEVILGSQKLDEATLVSIQESLSSIKAVSIQGLDANASSEIQLTNSGGALSYDGATQTPFLEPQICLWSCQTGAGIKGKQFMNTLANMTNATIFATENLVGNQAKGGTWDLEKTACPRRAAPFSAEARDGFEGVLPITITGYGDLALSSDNNRYLNGAEAADGLFTLSGTYSGLSNNNWIRISTTISGATVSLGTFKTTASSGNWSVIVPFGYGDGSYTLLTQAWNAQTGGSLINTVNHPSASSNLSLAMIKDTLAPTVLFVWPDAIADGYLNASEITEDVTISGVVLNHVNGSALSFDVGGIP